MPEQLRQTADKRRNLRDRRRVKKQRRVPLTFDDERFETRMPLAHFGKSRGRKNIGILPANSQDWNIRQGLELRPHVRQRRIRIHSVKRSRQRGIVSQLQSRDRRAR